MAGPLGVFERLCRQRVGEAPEREYRFAPPRRWRFDYAWPSVRVALEVEGGVWIRGRHTRGKGFIADLEKYSEAAARGWRILRVTPDQLVTGYTLDLVTRAVGQEETAR